MKLHQEIYFNDTNNVLCEFSDILKQLYAQRLCF